MIIYNFYIHFTCALGKDSFNHRKVRSTALMIRFGLNSSPALTVSANDAHQSGRYAFKALIQVSAVSLWTPLFVSTAINLSELAAVGASLLGSRTSKNNNWSYKSIHHESPCIEKVMNDIPAYSSTCVNYVDSWMMVVPSYRHCNKPWH